MVPPTVSWVAAVAKCCCSVARQQHSTCIPVGLVGDSISCRFRVSGVESLEKQPELTADEAQRQLEVEVSSLKRELAEVRKELAAKVSDTSCLPTCTPFDRHPHLACLYNTSRALQQLPLAGQHAHSMAPVLVAAQEPSSSNCFGSGLMCDR